MSSFVKKDDRDYFFKLFNGITDAVFIAERQQDGRPGSYIEVNDVACDLLGYGRQDLLGLSPYRINRIAVEEQGDFTAILEALQNEGKTLFRSDLLHRDGHWVPVEIGSQLFELDGREVYFSVARDITMRERYESSIKTLVRSTVGLTGQECLDEIVCNLCDWLAVDGAAIGLFSDDSLEIKSIFYEGAYHRPENLAVGATPFAELRRGDFSFHPEGAGRLFDGGAYGRLAKASGFIGCPMHGDDGGVIGLVYVYSFSPIRQIPHVEELLSVIASRAAAECERMHYVRKLSHREEMLRALFNSTAEAIIGIDMNGEVTFCNPSAVRMLAYENEDELIGRCFWKLVTICRDDEDSPGRCGCPFVASIARDGVISSEESFFTRRDGQHIPVEYWGHPMHRDGRLVGGVVTFIDISRRKTLEMQLQHSQRMEAIGTLTGGIAHDFNNILTVISGYVGLLQSELGDSPELLTRVGKIGEAAERGSKLTHGLLAYSRKKSEPSTPVDLNALVLNVQELFGRIIGEGIAIRMDLSAERLVVLADSSQLEQVLVNLATNARDAMEGHGTLTMKTERTTIDGGFCRMYGYGAPGDYALIVVGDTGVGIPKGIRQKIFDPFFTTKDTGKGTGLGLAMAWGIVKQHKGYILVDSSREQGAEFRIYLPLTDRPPELAADREEDELPGGHERILLVEDDPLVREATGSILSSAGYRVTACECAEDALGVLRRRPAKIDLILSDVVMPGMKGSEFYREARKICDRPFVFMSGYTFNSLREQGFLKNEVRLLNKPIGTRQLLLEIRQTLNNNRH